MKHNYKLSFRLLSVFLCAVLMLGCVPLSAAAKSTLTTDAPEDLLLATLSDIHYYPESLSGSKGADFVTYTQSSNCVFEDISAITDATLATLKNDVESKGLKYIVLSGDLTINGEYDGHVALAQKLHDFEEDTGARVFVINGNHDINNSDASSFVNDIKEPARITTPTEFADIYKEFGFDEAYHSYKDFTANSEGCLSYSIDLDEGYRLIFIDGGRYTYDNTVKKTDEHETAGSLSENLLNWVLGEIADAKADGKTPIGFTHWNMSGMNYLHEHVLQGFVINDGYMLQETLADAGMHYVFSGHQHVSDIDITYSDSGEPMYSVITPTLTEFPFEYRETYFDYTGDKLDVTFNTVPCDAGAAVKTPDGGTYTSPYAQSAGFGKQFGAGASDYLLRMVKGMLTDLSADITAAGGLIKYIEAKANIDISAKVDELIRGGLVFSGTNILTSANIMAFLNDLDSQIMSKYLNNMDYTCSVIKPALDNICNVKVSEIPCTKYLVSYGFGSTTEGGTIGDMLMSVIVMMYTGNEDISDDMFLQDVLKNCNSTDFVNLIFDSAIKYVVDDVVVDEILANIEVHINSFFVDHAANVADYIQEFYKIVTAAIKSGIFKSTSVLDFAKNLYNLIYNSSDISYKFLAEEVLKTGLVTYGKTIDEVVYNVLESFIGDTEKQATAYQLYIILDTICNDEDLDNNVTYTYRGAESVTPTTEDMQLPSNVTLSPGEDAGFTMLINWYTKYSVKGTDIEIYKAENAPAFTGTASSGTGITAQTSEEKLNYYGFSFGKFGILPYSQNVIRHTLTVTSLEPGVKYVYRIGDAEKGFWSETGSFTTAAGNNGEFTFVNVTDSYGVTPGQYGVWADTLSAAVKMFNPSFVLHSGNMVYSGEDDAQWTWALDSAQSSLLNTPILYTSGTKDANGEYSMLEHFGIDEDFSAQLTDVGAFYSYDYNNAHFIVLNSNYLAKDGGLSDKQLSWLRRDLEKNTRLWTIVSINKSLYGNSEENAPIRAQLINLMNEYNIDVILQGSDMAYIRTDILKNDVPVSSYGTEIQTIAGRTYVTYNDPKGVVAIISGSAGANRADSAPESELFLKSETATQPMFMAVTVSGETIAFDICRVNDKGTAVRYDSFALDKTKKSAKLGDVTLDGQITSADARLALRYAVGLQNMRPAQKLAADVNIDKAVTAADARLVLRAAVGLEEISPEYVYYYASDLENLGF